MYLVILGRQGSGKGTQCTRLVEHYGCPHVSTGDMLRAAREEGTEMGRKAGEIMDAGGLVPDEVMFGIVAERLAKPDVLKHGVLLDGFPRTAGQADELERMLAEHGERLDVAINLDVPVEEVTKRMLTRGREDDTPEAIAERLRLYEEQTAPLVEWFDGHGLLAVVDGLGEEDEVFHRLVATVDAKTRGASQGEPLPAADDDVVD
ncbi:MAG: adenylate kinase [Acidimicrobiales bacterium]|nr:adenylate kinase [Acidimicrobiales bacterium]